MTKRAFTEPLQFVISSESEKSCIDPCIPIRSSDEAFEWTEGFLPTVEMTQASCR